MKTLILLVLCAVYSLPLTAQNWEPFVYGKKYFYSQDSEEGTRIKWFELDTVQNFEDNFFFHPIPCDDWNFGHILEMYPRLYGAIELPDPLSFWRDGSLIYFLGPNPNEDDFPEFVLRPNSRPGDSWVSFSNEVKCIEERFELVLGTLDSTRVFECVTESSDTLVLVLSKSFGLIRFPPINNFTLNDGDDFAPDLILIGEENIGYQVPEFENYFDLHVGDLLYWMDRSVIYLPEMKTDTTFYIDTILSVARTNDSISYQMHRAVYNALGKYLSSSVQTRHFLKNREGKLLAQQTGWFTTAPLPFDPHIAYGIDALLQKITGVDTVTTACIESVTYDSDPTDCELFPYIDNTDTYCYTTPIGLTSEYHWSLGGEHWIGIIGSIIDGIADGIVLIPTATSEIFLEKVNVYPNPVTDILHIPSNTESISLFNMQGSLIQIQRSNAAIDVSDFQPGLYVLHLTNFDGSLSIARVIKQ